MSKIVSWASAALLMAAMLGGAPARAACGDSVIVQRGDTVSRIAARCGVSESALLAANPAVKGSGDLQVGTALRTRPGTAGSGLGTALSNLGNSAVNAVTDLADKVGTSTQDLLDRHPELKSKLQDLGGSVGLTSRPSDAPSVVMTPERGARGSTVTVAATGLAPDEAVSIGAGPPGAAYEIVGRARTSGNGTVAADVVAPDAEAGVKAVVFVFVNGDGTILGRSGPFLLEP